MSKMITYKVGKNDIYGNQIWIYNFVDTESKLSQVELNEQFKCIGRMSKYGIRSKLNPNELRGLLGQFGFSNNIKASSELGYLQKRIDSCNSKNGCSSCCSQSHMRTCNMLNYHYKNLEILNECLQFLKAPIVEGK